MLGWVVRLQVVAKAADIQKSIDEGATAFLATEYYYLSIFMVRGEGRAWSCCCGSPRYHQAGVHGGWKFGNPKAPFSFAPCSLLQVIFSVLIFSLLSIVTPEDGRTHEDEVRIWL